MRNVLLIMILLISKDIQINSLNSLPSMNGNGYGTTSFLYSHNTNTLGEYPSGNVDGFYKFRRHTRRILFFSSIFLQRPQPDR